MGGFVSHNMAVPCKTGNKCFDEDNEYYRKAVLRERLSDLYKMKGPDRNEILRQQICELHKIRPCELTPARNDKKE